MSRGWYPAIPAGQMNGGPDGGPPADVGAGRHYDAGMCRNIKPLFNFAPPATDADIRAASLQFVRKIAGTTKPSKQNTEAFDRAVEEIFRSSKQLLEGLVATTPPKDRARFEQLKRLRYAKAEAR